MSDPGKASALVSALVRAYKAMAMYPEGHPARDRFFQNLLSEFSTSLNDSGTLEMVMDRETVSVSGRKLASRDGSDRFLAGESFSRQISTLRFLRGITAEDFKILFGIYALEPQTIRETGGPVEYLRGQGSGFLQVEQIDYSGILERRVDVGGEGGSRYGSEDSTFAAPPQGLTDLQAATPTFLREEKEEVGQREWLEIKLDELDRATTLSEYTAVLREIMTSLRATGTLGLPQYAALVLQRLGVHLQARVPEEIARVSRAAIRELAQPVVLEEMVVPYTSRDQPDRETTEVLFLVAREAAIPVLLRRLAEEDEAFGRRVLINMIGKFGPGIRPYLDRWLEDDRWYVVRNALGLLQQVGGTADSARVREFLRHPHPKVRLEALRFLNRFPAPVQEDLLDELLGDEDLEVQARAIYSLGTLQGPAGLDRLLVLARKPFWGEGDLVRREMAIKGIGREGSPAAVQFLESLLKSRGFVNPKGREKIHQASVSALADIGDTRALRVIQDCLPRLRGAALRSAEEFLRRKGEGQGASP